MGIVEGTKVLWFGRADESYLTWSDFQVCLAKSSQAYQFRVYIYWRSAVVDDRIPDGLHTFWCCIECQQRIPSFWQRPLRISVDLFGSHDSSDPSSREIEMKSRDGVEMRLQGAFRIFYRDRQSRLSAVLRMDVQSSEWNRILI